MISVDILDIRESVSFESGLKIGHWANQLGKSVDINELTECQKLFSIIEI